MTVRLMLFFSFHFCQYIFCVFSLFLYIYMFLLFSFLLGKSVLDLSYIHITLNDLKAIHQVICSVNDYVYCANFTLCSITFLEPYIYLLCTNCISWKYDLLYVKRQRAKSSTSFPSSTCIINCPNASNSHLPDSLAYLLYLPIKAVPR